MSQGAGSLKDPLLQSDAEALLNNFSSDHCKKGDVRSSINLDKLEFHDWKVLNDFPSDLKEPIEGFYKDLRRLQMRVYNIKLWPDIGGPR